jgi:hypothetical protein
MLVYGPVSGFQKDSNKFISSALGFGLVFEGGKGFVGAGGPLGASPAGST